MSTSEAPARVPAWKRLGLKLKYAKDTAQGAENTQSQVDKIPSVTSTDTLNKPQKRPFETTQPPTPLKRSKPVNKGPPIHSNPSGGKRSAFDDYQRSRAQAPQRYTGSLGPSGTLQAAGVAPKKIVFDDDDHSQPLPQPAAQIVTPVQELTRPSSPRKSVSFAPETKEQDGICGQNLFKTWAAGEIPADTTATPVADDETKQTEQKKKVKKSKSTLISKSDAAKGDTAPSEATHTAEETETSTQAPPYVEYLQQYYLDRVGWKFSKKHQNNLLKNLFNIYHISPEYNPAIVQYISGLQGSARLRVAESALGILKAIWEKHKDEQEMSVDTPAARRVAYYRALHRHIERFAASGAVHSEYVDQQVEEIKREVEQGKRSEQILEHMEDELEKAIDKELAAEATSRQAVNTSKAASSTSEPVKSMSPVSKEASKAPLSEKSEKRGRKKRKARTQTSEDGEESSSESSSDNESE